MITFSEFREILTSAPNCAKFELTFGKEKHLITKYDEYISYSPFDTDSKEEYFSSLEELNEKKSIRGVKLEDLWPQITDAVAVSSYNLCDEKEKSEYFSFLSENQSISCNPNDSDFSVMSEEEKKNNLYNKQKQTLDLFLEHGAISHEQYKAGLNELEKIINKE